MNISNDFTTEVNFNNLPQVVAEMAAKQNALIEYIYNTLTPPKKRPAKANIKGLLDYIEEQTGKRFARQTIYGLASSGNIPKEKHGRELTFNLNHIDQWLNNGKSMKGLKLED